MDQNEAIKLALEPLLREAEQTGMWLYHNGLATGELWFSPAELRAANKEGRFIWGPINWRLLPPDTAVSKVDRKIDDLLKEKARLLTRVAEQDNG